MEYSKRKHTRLRNYDYSQPGYYYVTIHVQDATVRLSNVGMEDGQAKVRMTMLGVLATQQLFELQNRYPFVKIEKYVIMPTHIHGMIQLLPGEAMRPGLTDIVCTYKSMTTRIGNQMLNTPGRKLFQTSFYETVLRNERACQECWRYIDENPIKWILKEQEKEFVPPDAAGDSQCHQV